MAELMRKLDEHIAGLPGVNARVRAEAQMRGAIMRSIIAPHSKSGELLGSIFVEAANDKDYIVGSSDPNAVSKNYGTSRTRGIHFIEGAM
ncbi:DUF5403 family protein [Streptomyces sp. NPDC127112]|uniref:DUF5403 family protein n=1 Tax=Streptomyces sp. NPDC127112 TaxID=3345364 RepID=UPI00363D3C92